MNLDVIAFRISAKNSPERKEGSADPLVSRVSVALSVGSFVSLFDGWSVSHSTNTQFQQFFSVRPCDVDVDFYIYV
jgi:hypothetical protein